MKGVPNLSQSYVCLLGDIRKPSLSLDIHFQNVNISARVFLAKSRDMAQGIGKHCYGCLIRTATAVA